MSTKAILATITIFSLLLANLWAQEKKNQIIQSSNDNFISTLPDSTSVSGNFKFSGYGGLEVRVTSFAGKWGVLIGGKGGLFINRKFTIGLIGAEFTHKVERGYDDSSGVSQTVEIEMRYGGIYFEYTWGLPKIVHLSIPIDLVAMGINIKKKDSSNKSNDNAMFGIIPRFNVEFNISSFFIISLTGGYRFALGGNNDYMDSYDAWGPEVGVFFKFGKF